MTYYDTVKRILIIIFVINISVALVKGAYGLLTNSLSMTADGLHSLFDSVSNVIGLFGLALASKPPDKEHPYGHSKFETFASLGIAVLLFTSSFQVIEATINRFLNPAVPEINSLSFVIMGATLAINVGVSASEHIMGKRLKSSILVADSMHTRSDIYASLGGDPGLCGGQDGLSSGRSIHRSIHHRPDNPDGLEIIKESSKILLDKAFIEESVIRKLAESVEGVCNCHHVRSHGSPGDMYMDLQIGVDSTLSIEEAHKVGEEVEEKIKSSIPGVHDVVVHMEPKEYCELNGQ